jgi:hypothetical protein
MWKRLWKKWTIDKPAALGDWLWEVLVVRLAVLLDRLTLRRVIAFIPVLILILAYAHRIPIPPELMLVGDVLAYIDIFSVILLLGIMGRVTAVWFFVKQVAGQAVQLASRALAGMRRLDFRHRREAGAKTRRRLIGRAKDEDDGYAVIRGVVWAW